MKCDSFGCRDRSARKQGPPPFYALLSKSCLLFAVFMCVKTIYLRKRQQEVPCGKCYQCVRRRRNDWFIRAKIERMNSPYCIFGLLTYAETDFKLNKRDVQLFLKRLRIKGYTLKYLIVGEYGEEKERPHWHCLFFSKVPIAFNDIAISWKGGYDDDTNRNKAGWVNFSNVRSDKALRYCVKYIYKYDGTEKKFEMMVSKQPALGIDYLKNQVFHLEQKSTKFRVNGVPVAMPRYYKRKIFDDYPDIKEEVNDALAATVARLDQAELEGLSRQYPDLSYGELLNIKDKLNEQRNDYERSKERNRKKSR